MSGASKCPYRLRSCVWEITLACCFSCQYCGSSGGTARPDELSTEECLDIADQLSELGCRRVSLIGGEVFMRPDWDTITGRLTSNGIRVAIITNGFLFTPRLLERIKAVNLESVAISLDGPEEIHDKYRQKGSYQRAKSAMQALTAAGIPVSLISTLNHENVQYLDRFYQTVKAWPIFAWQLQACSPMGNAANGGIDYRFDPNDVIRFVSDHMFKAPFLIGIADNIGYYTKQEGSLRGNLSGNAKFRGCRAGLSSIGITSSGDVRGCESMYDPVFNEGSLREKTLREIWESPTAFRYNRQFTPDKLTGACSRCEYGKYCAGGCRSYNHFVHGNLYEFPRCAKTNPDMISAGQRRTITRNL